MLPLDENLAMTPPDHDDSDPLDDRQAEIEARFRELERDAEIERLRAQGGASRAGGQSKAANRASSGGSETPDPLAEMKARLDGSDASGNRGRDPAQEDGSDASGNRGRDPAQEDEGERFLLVLCPKCQAKNRMSLTRVRTQSPICGGCRSPLSSTRR